MPNLCKCPMIGTLNGEGGSFLWLTEVARSRLMRKIVKAKLISERTKGFNSGELTSCSIIREKAGIFDSCVTIFFTDPGL